MRDKLYWSTFDGKIYRSNLNGTDVETVLSTAKYGAIYGLAFDWIVDNVYFTTNKGYILACGAGAVVTCFVILDGTFDSAGLCWTPCLGVTYWTAYPSLIFKAGMDGSNPTALVTGLGNPRGMTPDFATERLYWTEYSSHTIRFSNLDGNDLRTVTQRPSDSKPYGIAFWNDRIYWGNAGNFRLQTSTVDGQDFQTLTTETQTIRHITIASALNISATQTNHSERPNCSLLCVLTATSYRCLV